LLVLVLLLLLLLLELLELLEPFLAARDEVSQEGQGVRGRVQVRPSEHGPLLVGE
jgi:hypothetical protein